MRLVPETLAKNAFDALKGSAVATVVAGPCLLLLLLLKPLS